MSEVTLQRLLPEPGMVTAVEAVDGLVLAELAPDHRPYVVLNMVATVDGAAAVAHRTAPISNPAATSRILITRSFRRAPCPRRPSVG